MGRNTTKRKSSSEPSTAVLDGLLRDVVRYKFHNRCFKCHKPVTGWDSQPHHIIPKRLGLYARWHIPNLILLCLHCHRLWHDDVTEGSEWLKKTHPDIWEDCQKLRGIVIPACERKEFKERKRNELLAAKGLYYMGTFN